MAVAPGKLTAWLLALRPKTLPVSLSPILVGTAVVWHQQHQLALLPLLATLFAAALIQIGTNLFNDVGDYLRGGDPAGRLGPARATAEGWLQPAEVKRGAWLSFALAFACGIYLVTVGGWPIVLIGLASLAAGWAYTGGPYPIAYHPWGEFFVWLFFGLVAVGGSAYLQDGSLNLLALKAGNLIGLLAAAVITVNNHRDREADLESGRRTLAGLLGPRGTHHLYRGLMLLPFLLLPGLSTALGLTALLPLLALPLSLRLCHRFTREPVGPVFNTLLAQTALHQLLFSLLLTTALCL